MGVNVNLRKEIVNQIKLRLRSQADQSGHAVTRIPSTDMIELLTTTQVVEIAVTVNNSPIQDYAHPNDHIKPISTDEIENYKQQR